MASDQLSRSPSHRQPEETPKLFSAQPPIFILPTHLTLEKLLEIESRLIEHGGKLTYDISEAGLFLGKIGQKKRAALELRSRGIWTEEVSESSIVVTKGEENTAEPSLKRRKTKQTTSPGIEIVDLSTESESEEDGVKSQHDPSRHLVRATENPGNIVTVLKLEWLDHSILAGKALSPDSFLVYKGRRTTPPEGTPAVKPAPQARSNPSSLILERAKEDAAARPTTTFTSRFQARRSKQSPDGGTSQRQPPTLYRETTSDYDESIPLPPQPDWVRNHVLYACMRSTPLHPPNEDFISKLVKIRRIRELTLDEIGVRAYSTSIASLAAYPHLIRRPSEVLALPGCNEKIAHLFAEFKHHGGCSHADDDGNVAAADELETDPVLRVLNTFYEIWGVGAKTARDFYYSRGWRDLDDIIEHGWNSLSRVQQIGLKFYDEFLAGIPRAESEAIADIVKRHANLVRPEADGNVDCIIVGGYRRGKEKSGDVDLILTHRDDAVTRNLIVDVVASLETESYITHTLALHLTSTHREQQTLPFRGETPGQAFDTLDKALVVWQDPNFDTDHDKSQQNPNLHRRVDIIISPWRTIGCAVLGWSGDTTFQRDLRRYAKKAHAWKFDSSGVRERTSGGHVVDLERAGQTWEERERLVLEGLGVGWRPPQERCTR